jgi:hypothetical protein
MKNSGRIAGLALLAVLVLSLGPVAYASNLTVDLNPNTQVAKLTSVSTTNLLLNYPANSTLSAYLKGYNSSLAQSGSFNSSSPAVLTFREHFHDEANDKVSISNMTISYKYNVKANSTALVVNKETDITAWVSGAFKVSNGTVTANLGWRSFYISGALDVRLGNQTVDVNLVGASLTQSIAGKNLGAEMLSGMFAGGGLWARPTLNFSSLNSPLSSWTRNYDSLTNTTTFSKTVAGNSTFSAKYSNNGEAYSLSMTSDPSAAISTRGYAQAAGDSLVISTAPVYLNPISWVAVAAAAGLVVAVGAVYFARRLKSTGENPDSTSR